MMHSVFKEHIQRGDTVVAVLDPPRYQGNTNLDLEFILPLYAQLETAIT